MRLKIRYVLIIVFLLIATAGVGYIFVSVKRLQNMRNYTLLAEDNYELQGQLQETEDGRNLSNHSDYFYAVEFLVEQAARNEKAKEFNTVSDDTDTVQSGFLPVFQDMTPQNSGEFFLEQGKKQLEELFNDTGFIAYLNTMNLVLSGDPYEDLDFVFFDFMTLDNIRLGSIGVQKRAGGIYLFDDEYISLGAIQTFGLINRGISADITLDIDTLPAGTYEGGKNHIVLIGGTDQRMTDTLILAMLNEDTQSIDLFSLPRDLFYNNQKINHIFYHQGTERLIMEMENLTGFTIDNFIIIDMYAFIDVINILGGIDITFNAPLIDPAYRVRDNGRWSTLFYPAGTHHLNGIEAVRVARSRNLISDFGRARHQQLILTAIIDKITELGVSDIGKVFELAVVFMQYVETDYALPDLIRNILRFRSVKVQSQTVLDSGNILYSTYENLWRTGLSADEVDEDFYMGQYILLPLNEDWSLIHRFIRSVIEESVESD